MKYAWRRMSMAPVDDLRRSWGENIRTYRRTRDMSQKDLSSACGVEQSTVSRWERAEIVPTESHKILIAEALNTDARVIFPLTRV